MTQSGGELDLVGVELEKCGGEHGIRQGRTRRGELDRGRKRRIPVMSIFMLIRLKLLSQSDTILE